MRTHCNSHILLFFYYFCVILLFIFRLKNKYFFLLACNSSSQKPKNKNTIYAFSFIILMLPSNSLIYVQVKILKDGKRENIVDFYIK